MISINNKKNRVRYDFDIRDIEAFVQCLHTKHGCCQGMEGTETRSTRYVESSLRVWIQQYIKMFVAISNTMAYFIDVCVSRVRYC